MLFITMLDFEVVRGIIEGKGGSYMDIVIRNINPSTVQDIDEKARDMDMSRQEYLKDMLENLTILEQINNREREYRVYLDKMYQMMKLTRDQLEKNTNTLNQLMEDDI